MKDEGGNAGRKERVSYVQVPCHPLPLEPIKLGIVDVQGRVELSGSVITDKSGIEGHAEREKA